MTMRERHAPYTIIVPLQCAAQACWDEKDFFGVYAEPKATRQDIIRDKNLLRLVWEHEKRCAYTELDRWVAD